MRDLVELVDRDERAVVLVRREPEGGEHPGQQPAVVDPDERALEAEGIHRVEGGDEQLGLGARPGLAQHVDVALHELPVAPLLRALGPPHRGHLDAAEHRRQLGAVGRVEAGQRHRQVEAQAQVGEVERLLRGLQVVVGETALEDAERELLVVAAESGVQALGVLRDRGLDLVEAVAAVHPADDGEDRLAPGLVGGEEVAHAARRIDLLCHPPSLPAGALPTSRSTDRGRRRAGRSRSRRRARRRRPAGTNRRAPSR